MFANLHISTQFVYKYEEYLAVLSLKNYLLAKAKWALGQLAVLPQIGISASSLVFFIFSRLNTCEPPFTEKPISSFRLPMYSCL